MGGHCVILGLVGRSSSTDISGFDLDMMVGAATDWKLELLLPSKRCTPGKVLDLFQYSCLPNELKEIHPKKRYPENLTFCPPHQTANWWLPDSGSVSVTWLDNGGGGLHKFTTQRVNRLLDVFQLTQFPPHLNHHFLLLPI